MKASPQEVVAYAQIISHANPLIMFKVTHTYENPVKML